MTGGTVVGSQSIIGGCGMSDELEYQRDNIIVGSAELTAVRTATGICWMLPGRGMECNRDAAEDFAAKLDVVISKNLTKYSRRLFRR